MNSSTATSEDIARAVCGLILAVRQRMTSIICDRVYGKGLLTISQKLSYSCSSSSMRTNYYDHNITKSLNSSTLNVRSQEQLQKYLPRVCGASGSH